jgi:hypothetical protein
MAIIPKTKDDQDDPGNFNSGKLFTQKDKSHKRTDSHRRFPHGHHITDWSNPKNKKDSFSQERLTYLPKESRIIYHSKDNRQEKILDTLEWLAAITSQISFKIAMLYFAYFKR